MVDVCALRKNHKKVSSGRRGDQQQALQLALTSGMPSSSSASPFPVPPQAVAMQAMCNMLQGFMQYAGTQSASSGQGPNMEFSLPAPKRGRAPKAILDRSLAGEPAEESQESRRDSQQSSADALETPSARLQSQARPKPRPRPRPRPRLKASPKPKAARVVGTRSCTSGPRRVAGRSTTACVTAASATGTSTALMASSSALEGKLMLQGLRDSREPNCFLVGVMRDPHALHHDVKRAALCQVFHWAIYT